MEPGRRIRLGPWAKAAEHLVVSPWFNPPEADKPARGGQAFDSPPLGAVKMVSD